MVNILVNMLILCLIKCVVNMMMIMFDITFLFIMTIINVLKVTEVKLFQNQQNLK